MEIILAPLVIAILLAPPFMSARMAQSFGRSYWMWFFIGCILPIIANLIIACLPTVRKKQAVPVNKIPRHRS